MEDSAACASQAERGLLGSVSRERDKSAEDLTFAMKSLSP